MKKSLLLMMSMLMMISISVFSQTRTISGTVTDSKSGEPVIGATVTIKGTSTGTITDTEGTFLLRTDQTRVRLSHLL